MSDEPELVRVARQGGIATVVMNRPPVNAISPPLVVRLAEAFSDLGADASVRCIVLRSALDRYFMAGADISMMASGEMAGEDQPSPGSLPVRFTQIERTPKPVIAAVSGHALGGGCELALCCDYRLMIDDGRSTIGLTETSLGLIPGGGGTQRLPRLVGRRHATALIFEGIRLQAREALAIGLVDEALPPDAFEAGVREKAERLASMATRALGLAKLSMLEGLDVGVPEGVSIEHANFMRVIGSADAALGMTAFLSKRRANFTGQ